MADTILSLGVKVDSKDLKTLEQNSNKAAKATDKLTASLTNETTATAKLTKELVTQQKTQAAAMAGAGQSQEKATQTIIECCKQCAAYSSQTNKNLAEGNALLGKTADATKTVTEEAKKTADAYKESLTKAKDFWSGLERSAISQVETLSNYSKHTQESFKTLTESVDKSFNTMWVNAAKGGSLTKDAFENTLDSIKVTFKGFLGELAHIAVTKPIMVSVIGTLGGILGGSNTANAMVQAMGGSGGAEELLSNARKAL